LFVYHLHMGGPDAAAIEWSALRAPRFQSRLMQSGVAEVDAARQADVVVVTGLLTLRNLDSVLAELATTPSPSVLVAAGDSVINPKGWSRLKLPGLAPYALNHYVEVQISVPGNPPTPQALIAAIAAASKLLSQPRERLRPLPDQ
jgi:Ni,Fe-hydrogenase III small subunit